MISLAYQMIPHEAFHVKLCFTLQCKLALPPKLKLVWSSATEPDTSPLMTAPCALARPQPTDNTRSSAFKILVSMLIRPLALQRTRDDLHYLEHQPAAWRQQAEQHSLAPCDAPTANRS